MTEHACRRPTSCCCRADSLDPSEDCPVHGAGEWPRRCGECGRFMFWQEPKEEEKECAMRDYLAKLAAENELLSSLSKIADGMADYIDHAAPDGIVWDSDGGLADQFDAIKEKVRVALDAKPVEENKVADIEEEEKCER